MRPGRQLPLETHGIEAKFSRMTYQGSLIERRLMLEQPIMHLPELPLCAGRLGGERSEFGMG